MYMAAMTMLSVCDPSVPKQIIESIGLWTHRTPSGRPKDALVYFAEFQEIAKAIYGAPKWHDLNVPGGPAQIAV